MSEKPISHISLGISQADDIGDHYMIYIHRGKGATNVNSYGTPSYWERNRKARRLLRFLRLCNAFAKRAMTGREVQ